MLMMVGSWLVGIFEYIFAMSKDASLICDWYDSSSKSDISWIEFFMLNLFGSAMWEVKISENLLASLSTDKCCPNIPVSFY
jgi:hypothetical protein